MDSSRKTTPVSVVVPTRGNRQSLRGSVQSALTQTRPPEEVVVVVDSDDPQAEQRVRSLLADLDGVAVLRNPGPHGPAASRMFGYAQSSQPLIAFLDDDDLWLPAKLEQQVAAIPAESEWPDVVVLTRCTILADGGSYVRPLRLPVTGQDAGSYLFERPSMTGAGAYVATPSMLTTRGVLDRHPWNADWRNLEDLEWLVRCTSDGVRMVYLDDVLTVVEARNAVARASQASGCRAPDMQRWAEQVLAPRSRRWYANYLLSHVVRTVLAESGRAAAARLAVRALLLGPSGPALVTAVIAVAMPAALPGPFRTLLHRLRGRRTTG